MTKGPVVGIGELLRHLLDLFDRDAERIYARLGLGLDYRARYTPILRTMDGGPLSITELQQRIRITQGAVSQTVKLMEAEGLLWRVESEDRRARKVALTEKGAALRRRLLEEWNLHLAVIAELEAEIGLPLRDHLMQAIAGLERESFERRIEKVRQRPGAAGLGAGARGTIQAPGRTGTG